MYHFSSIATTSLFLQYTFLASTSKATMVKSCDYSVNPCAHSPTLISHVNPNSICIVNFVITHLGHINIMIKNIQ